MNFQDSLDIGETKVNTRYIFNILCLLSLVITIEWAALMFMSLSFISKIDSRLERIETKICEKTPESPR